MQTNRTEMKRIRGAENMNWNAAVRDKELWWPLYRDHSPVYQTGSDTLVIFLADIIVIHLEHFSGYHITLYAEIAWSTNNTTVHFGHVTKLLQYSRTTITCSLVVLLLWGIWRGMQRLHMHMKLQSFLTQGIHLRHTLKVSQPHNSLLLMQMLCSNRALFAQKWGARAGNRSVSPIAGAL